METMDARILPDGRTVVVVDREHPTGWHDSIGLDLPVYIARNASSAFEPAVPPTLEQSVAFDNVTAPRQPSHRVTAVQCDSATARQHGSTKHCRSKMHK